jgi:hypothetical protein
MTQNSTLLSGTPLEQFMDRVEVAHQEHGADFLLSQLQAQPLKAVSLESIARLHVLWVNAGDAEAAKTVLAQDGRALIEVTQGDARNELKVNLLIHQLRLANYLKDEHGLLQALDNLQQLTKEPLQFEIEQYRRNRIFEDLQHTTLDVALSAIEVSYTLALINPCRRTLRAWDNADKHRRRAMALATHNRDKEAREAALMAIAALHGVEGDQDVDVNDWLWLGDALIEIVPMRLAMFEKPVTCLIDKLPLPQRREWEVRLARLAARSLKAQGDLAGALKICEVATLSLGCDGSDSFIEFHLPWLLENGQIEEAGQRAFTEIYEMREEMWPDTAAWVHDRLLDAGDSCAWWPLCVMRACDDQTVLERFISGLPLLDESTFMPRAMSPIRSVTSSPRRLQKPGAAHRTTRGSLDYWRCVNDRLGASTPTVNLQCFARLSRPAICRTTAALLACSALMPVHSVLSMPFANLYRQWPVACITTGLRYTWKAWLKSTSSNTRAKRQTKSGSCC